MNKEDLFSSLIYILMGTIIIIVGLTVFRPAIESGYLSTNQGTNFGFVLLSLLIGILINVLFMEIGHAIGAKIGKYEVLSINMLGFCLYKVKHYDTGKKYFKFKFTSFNGLAGETKIAPKSEKSYPMTFVFMPLVLILLEFVALYCVNIFIKDSTSAKNLMFIKYGITIVATVGACFLLYNYFPAKLDSMTDGYRLIALSKKINSGAFNEKLAIEASEYYQEDYQDMKVFDEITDFTAQVNLITALMYYRKGDTEKALEIIDNLLDNEKKIAKSTVREVKFNKIFITFMTKDVQEGEKLIRELNDDEMSVLRSCKTTIAIRTYILYIGLVEKSYSEIQYALSKKKKAAERLNPGEALKEINLIDSAVQKVKDTYPNIDKKAE